MTDLLVDGNSLFARVWYAVNEDPEQTVEVFVKQVLQLLDPVNGKLGFRIDRTLFAWDGKSKTEKNRKAKPAEYIPTRRRLQEALLDLFGTVHGFHPDFEADDVVATVAFNSKARRVVVVSGDKDLMQLHGGNVIYYCLYQKAILSNMAICKKFKGIKRPIQSAIALAIIGDSVDGIPGVPKWGPKKVEKVFEAVPEGMNFTAALETIERQIPDDLLEEFRLSLDKTLLHNDVPDQPEPEPLVFCDPRGVLRLGIDNVLDYFERVAERYDEGESVAETMLRESRSGSLRPNHG